MEEQKSDTDKQAAVFSTLADPTRLKLVKLLCRQQEPHALCVNALAGLLGVTQSAVSQHLRLLKTIGIVRGERRGSHVHYFVNHEVLGEFRQMALAALSPNECDCNAVELCRENCKLNCPKYEEIFETPSCES